MRTFGYGLGILLLILAAAAAVAQLLMIWAAGGYRPVSLGTIWYNLDANSLVGFQSLIEKSLSPLLWPPVQFLLSVPAAIVLAIPGLLLFLACRPRHRGFA